METLLSLDPHMLVYAMAFILTTAWAIPKTPGKQAALRKILTGLMPDLHTVVEGIKEYREASETVEVSFPKEPKIFVRGDDDHDA